jgi:GDPmannose 4,6-dehydratase
VSNTKPRAVITGITGQDGAYLAALLLAKGYEVFGTYRRTSSVSFWRLNESEIKDHDNLYLVESDLTDLSSAIRLLQQAEPSEVYNLAAQSFVGVSFEQPITTADITGLGALNLLEAVRIVNPLIRFYQASTSEMFGKVEEVPQTERTPFYPRSPYGTAKLFAHWSTVNYREAYGIFASSGILFNHESPLRGIEFVTRKITDGLSKVHLGYEKQLELGNLDAKRDWGYAPEYVEGMWKMLQHTKADTFVLATGITKTVRDFVTIAGRVLGMNISFEGEGSSEIGIDVSSGKTIVKVNPMFYRPAEVDLLVGNASKAAQELDWQPGTSLESLCESMVSSDLRRNKR